MSDKRNTDSVDWLERWKSNNIGFHQPQAHTLLVNNFAALGLSLNARVFIPLCGKTLDISWLLDRGFRVIGVELSPLAIEQLFSDLGLTPKITKLGKLIKYDANKITLFVGDVFELNQELIGTVEAVYDRGALVALDDTVRSRYAEHVIAITQQAPQLVINYEYDQSLMAGPPFSIDDDTMNAYYGQHYDATILETLEISQLKGLCSAEEKIWLMSRIFSSSI